MTELSFLIELLLKHKLEADTKDAIAIRIRKVADAMMSDAIESSPYRPRLNVEPQARVLPPPVPIVAQIAHTPAAQAAMASREQAIAEAIAGKVNKDTGRPRKF